MGFEAYLMLGLIGSSAVLYHLWKKARREVKAFEFLLKRKEIKRRLEVLKEQEGEGAKKYEENRKSYYDLLAEHSDTFEKYGIISRPKDETGSREGSDH